MTGSIRRLTHLGFCISDLGRSLAFYTQALGFEEVGRFRGEGPDVYELLQLPEQTQLTAVYLERDGWRIELLHYPRPGHAGDGSPRPMNLLGLTHLSFVVSDLDAVCEAVRKHGGRVLEETRRDFGPGSRGLFVVDPDGIRFELLEHAGDPLAIPGQRSGA